MTPSTNRWTGSVYRGWREAGHLPGEIQKQLPEAVREAFSEVNDLDSESCQTYTLALHKELDRDPHTSATISTHDATFGDYSCSRWTQAHGDALKFFASVLAVINSPQSEWLYILFLNRLRGDETFPGFPITGERVNCASAGLTEFSRLTHRSIDGDRSFHWVLLTLLRDIRIDPSWRTSTVLDLARGISADGAFDRLPILADALQDAGCDDEVILNRCRQLGEHTRSCWVTDRLLAPSQPPSEDR